MFPLIFLLTAVVGSTTPPQGCYFFEVDANEDYYFRLQVNLKTSTALSLYIVVNLNLRNPGEMCLSEYVAYSWNNSNSTLTMGMDSEGCGIPEHFTMEYVDYGFPTNITIPTIVIDAGLPSFGPNVTVPFTLAKLNSCQSSLEFQTQTTALPTQSTATTISVLTTTDTPATSPKSGCTMLSGLAMFLTMIFAV